VVLFNRAAAPGSDASGSGGLGDNPPQSERGTITVTTTLDVPTSQDIDPRSAGIMIEALIRQWNLEYDYNPEFPLEELRVVDWTQVRDDAAIHDKETLAEFRTQMAQGAVYPPIVLMDPNVLVEGNHRVAAARGLRRKTFAAFIVKFNSVDLAKSFGASTAQLSGRRLTSTEAFNAATTMMNRGMADDAIARSIGRSVTSVREMRRRNEFAERSARIPEITKLAEGISEKARIKLAQIPHDAPFVEAVRVAAETRAPAKTVSEIVQVATAARTDADAVTAIRELLRKELAPAGPPPYRVVIPLEVKQARMHLGGLVKLAADPASLLDVASPDLRADAMAKWAQVRDLAAAVIELYGKQ